MPKAPPKDTRSLRDRRTGLAQLDPIDGALELMYFGWKGMTRGADAVLAEHGLARAHHRILFVVARKDGVTVGALAETLGISKQALHRPLKTLLDLGLVIGDRDAARLRHKPLRLSDAGRSLEHAASERERAVMRSALADPAARDAWAAVMSRIAEAN